MSLGLGGIFLAYENDVPSLLNSFCLLEFFTPLIGPLQLGLGFAEGNYWYASEAVNC
jgi:hypothetical protein